MSIFAYFHSIHDLHQLKKALPLLREGMTSYAAVMALPEKQAKRIYARYYLGMRVSEIATAEGVDQSRVRDSIRRGLKQLAKYF